MESDHFFGLQSQHHFPAAAAAAQLPFLFPAGQNKKTDLSKLAPAEMQRLLSHPPPPHSSHLSEQYLPSCRGAFGKELERKHAKTHA